jgi:hypothetical protein
MLRVILASSAQGRQTQKPVEQLWGRCETAAGHLWGQQWGAVLQLWGSCGAAVEHLCGSTCFNLLHALAGNSIGGVPDGAQHRKQREVLSPHFRTDYIRTLVPCFTRCAGCPAFHMTADDGARDVGLGAGAL